MNKREICSPPHTIQKRKQSHSVINVLDNVDFVSPNVQSSHQEALLYVFEANEAAIKMIMKGISPDTETCFQNPQSCSWLVFWSNQFGLQSPNQIHWHQKTNSQTYWPREISHVMSGIIFCVCLTSAISVLPTVLKWCRKESKTMQVKKESQQNRSRWWIWSRDAATGLLMCYLLLHQKARGKPDMKCQFPLSPQTEQHQRTGRLVEDAYSSSYSEWNIDKTWSSQEWKSDELMEVRTGRPVFEQPPGLFTEHTDKFIVDDNDMDSDTEAESDMSLFVQIILAQGEWSSAKEAEPILKRCNKRQRQTFCFWIMFMSSTLQASVFMGRISQTICIPSKIQWSFSHNETDVRQIWEIDNRTIRRDVWNK